MTNVSEVGLFCASRPAIFERAAAVSTLRRAVFALGGELMSPGLDRVLAQARANATDPPEPRRRASAAERGQPNPLT
jgi:hypothetical protein